MRFLTWVAVALLALAHLASSAQSDVILRDKDVNESALIEALTPLQVPHPVDPRVAGQQRPGNASLRPAASMLITFETNSADLKPQAKKMLDTLGRAMASDKLSTSRSKGMRTRAAERRSIWWSQKRAEAVVSYLTGKPPHRRQPPAARRKGQSELFNLTQSTRPRTAGRRSRRWSRVGRLPGEAALQASRNATAYLVRTGSPHPAGDRRR